MKLRVRKNGYTLKGSNSATLFLPPFWTGGDFQKKEFPHWEQILSFNSKPYFGKPMSFTEADSKPAKLSSSVKMAGKLEMYSYPLNVLDRILQCQVSKRKGKNGVVV